MKPVRLSLEADGEFTSARKWYEQIDPLLAQRFYLTVRSAITEIQKHPEAWPLDEYLLIDAIAHQSREPNYWQTKG